MVANPPSTKPCGHCETPFARRPNDNDSRWNERRFCGRKCASLHSRQSKTGTDETLIEDLLWLTDPTAPRLPVQDVTRRLGFVRADSLYRRLYRAGRADLAAMLQSRDEVSAA
jgi:hypothetical protein